MWLFGVRILCGPQQRPRNPQQADPMGDSKVSGSFFGSGGSQDSQQGLRLLGSVAAEAGQVAPIRLVDQAFGMKAFGSGDGSRRGGLVDFQTFLGAVKGKSTRISSSATNSGVYDIRTPDFLKFIRG